MTFFIFRIDNNTRILCHTSYYKKQIKSVNDPYLFACVRWRAESIRVFRCQADVTDFIYFFVVFVTARALL